MFGTTPLQYLNNLNTLKSKPYFASLPERPCGCFDQIQLTPMGQRPCETARGPACRNHGGGGRRTRMMILLGLCFVNQWPVGRQPRISVGDVGPGSLFALPPDEDADELLGLSREKKDPFTILGLARNSDQAAVRPAFRKLAGKLHPDVAGTGDAAAFRKVLWAYRELSEPDSWLRWSATRARRSRSFERSMKFSEDFEELFEDAVDAGPDALDEWEEFYRRRQAEKAAQVQKTQQQLVRRIIQGSYEEKGSNHGRPVFRKALDTGESVAIYYWAEKDGADCDGWWIGAEVGGDMVFAFNVNQASKLPPLMGWRFPVRGPLDNSLRVLQGSNRSEVRVTFEA